VSFALVMPAAGSGIRLGADLPKALIEISGKPLFVHAALPFLQFESCAEAVMAVPQSEIERFRQEAEKHLGAGRVRVVGGGKTRQDSVFNALRSLNAKVDAVLIHDAARPMIQRNLIQRVRDALTGDTAAVVPGLPVADTLKRVQESDSTILNTVERCGLMAVQTPQAIRFDTAFESHTLAAQAGFQGTDDVSLIEHFHLGRIRYVTGDVRNFKITTSDDLTLAREILRHA